MNRKLRIVAVALFLTAAAAPAFAAGVGFHAGMAIDPDDVLIGIRWKSDPIEDAIYLVPSAEVGFGDITMVAGNLDAHYYFTTSSDLAPYVGLGLTVNWFDSEGDSNTEIGGSVLGGVMFNPKWFFEAKLGLGDVPDAKLVVGFYMP